MAQALCKQARVGHNAGMLTAFILATGHLSELPATADAKMLRKAVWLDLMEPTADERAKVEAILRVKIPAQAALSAIETSSRLYQSFGAVFMTANLVHADKDNAPHSSPITFILKAKQLVTLRYEQPHAFPNYVTAAKRETDAKDAWGVFINLAGTVIDRGADQLENVGTIVDGLTKEVFASTRQGTNGSVVGPKPNLELMIGRIGSEGDFTAKMSDSVLSIARMLTYAEGAILSHQPGKLKRENLAGISVLQHDISSITDYANLLDGKIQFLLDAIFGMNSIEQNNIMKILTVVSVAFVAPTLVASIYGMNFKGIPELQWDYGYEYGLILMAVTGLLPLWYFRRKGWF